MAIWLGHNGSSVLLMKRVVGLPGEAIGFSNGHVTVDGIRLDEPYVRFSSDWNREAVPCGFDEADLPVGLQIIGPTFGEEVVLRTAHAYQQATDWHTRQPAL